MEIINIILYWRSLSFLNLSNYEINGIGQIRNITRNTISNGSINSKNYITHHIIPDKESGNGGKNFNAHFLVMAAFKGLHPDPTYTVDHIDGNILNNHIDNLRWASKSEQALNRRYTYRKGRVIYQCVIGTKEIVNKWDKIIDAEQHFGVSSGTISKACKYHKIFPGGFDWYYEEDMNLNEDEIFYPYNDEEKFLGVEGSNYGNIRYNGIKIGTKDAQGYIKCNIKNIKTNQKNQIQTHIIIAYIFHGKKPSNYIINHKDGNKANNRPENLEYVTYSENTQHAYDIGLAKTVAIRQFTLTGKYIKDFPSIKAANIELFGIEKKTSIISECTLGKINDAYGFIWRKIDSYPNEPIYNIDIFPPKDNMKIIIKRTSMHVVPKVEYFGSLEDAANSVGDYKKIPSIVRTCYGKQKTCATFIWEVFYIPI